MFASRLSSFLAEEVRRVDISRRRPSDLKERFERLRGSALLPVGRRKNVQHLTPKQVTAGILSVVAEQPGFAGTVCISLLGLRPVGGVAASFAQSGTFGEAIESLISGGSDVGSLIQVRASASEIYTGSYCRASIEYVACDLRKVAHYVGSTAKHDMAGAVAYDWFFDRKALNSSVANKALALYRQGRNAETSFLVSYAVLSYYKILELKGGGKNGTKNWLRDNYDLAKEQKRHAPEFAEFERICGNSRPSDYLFKSCRTAVAHAEAHGVQSSDPDEFLELRRLHIAADILRVFARLFITQELEISESRFDGT